jgi:hypothetical protein
MANERNVKRILGCDSGKIVKNMILLKNSRSPFDWAQGERGGD